MLIEKIKKGAIIKLCKSSFNLCQTLGFHITPVHFYQPIPDTRTLKDELWTKESELIGIDLSEKEQLSLLSLFIKYKEEYEKLPRKKTSIPYEYYINNSIFGPVNAEILYCMIRFFRPKKIIEIGSGMSSFLIAQTIQKNMKDDGSYECEYTVIDPYPNDILSRGIPVLTKLIQSGVEEVPITLFEKLNENDILFIDSSHVIKIGNDVQVEYLEILPRLKRGVIIHIHDIFLPMDYPKNWILKEKRFWNEQYILQAFLAFNDKFKVIWASNFMHLKHPDILAASFNSYKQRPSSPGSFWIKRIQ
jgi:hypothetical protein